MADMTPGDAGRATTRAAAETPPLPPSIRFPLWLGNHFGLGLRFLFVPESQVQVIYRDGRYLEVRGPGIIRYRRWDEVPGPLVFTGAQILEREFARLFSRDVLLVNLRLRALVAFDPRAVAPELARVLTRLPRAAYASIAETYLRAALMAAVNKFNATEVARTPVLAQIETYVHQTVSSALEFLGLSLRGAPTILGVTLPPSLAERHELLARRDALIAAMGGDVTDPFANLRALITEAIERLDRPGESFVNLNEMLQTYLAEPRAAPSPPQAILPPAPAPRRELPPDDDSRL